MEKISVIIPIHNAEKTLGPCVNSVLNTHYPRLEIILVDDVSNDSTPQIIHTLLQNHGDTIRLVQMDKPSGPAKARNAGAEIAIGELFFFLDSDTVMDSNALHRFAKRIQEADAVVGIYEAEPLNPGHVPRYKGYLNNFFFSRKGIISYEVFDSSRAGIRSDIFRKLGGFNENLEWGMDYENEEIGYRIIKEHTILLDPDIHVGHHFPGFKKLTQTYFSRVSLWMEIFLTRRRFESGGVTSPDTGISTASLLLSALLLPFIWIHSGIALLALFLLFVYFIGYVKFFIFVAKLRLSFLPIAIILNIFFTLVLGSGAVAGVIRWLTGHNRVPTS
jgi:glycosyltransferase involved in cell wall biosynthesis